MEVGDCKFEQDPHNHLAVVVDIVSFVRSNRNACSGAFNRFRLVTAMYVLYAGSLKIYGPHCYRRSLSSAFERTDAIWLDTPLCSCLCLYVCIL